MPNIKVRGLGLEQVQALSGALTPKLCEAIGCPTDWLSFSGESLLFCNGQPLTTDVFFHVEWFDRGAEMKQKVADVITNTLKTIQGMEPIETITVVFVDLEGQNYYENGQHF